MDSEQTIAAPAPRQDETTVVAGRHAAPRVPPVDKHSPSFSFGVSNPQRVEPIAPRDDRHVPHAPDAKTMLDAYPPYQAERPGKKPSHEKSHSAMRRSLERNAAASDYLSERGPVTRSIAKGFLQVGNVCDVAISSLSHHFVRGPAGAFVGAIRGTFFGTLAMGACLLAGGAAFAIPAFAATLIGMTAYHGIKSYNKALIVSHKGDDVANLIGQKCGALPVRGGPENAKRLPSLASEILPQPDPNAYYWRDAARRSAAASNRGR